MPQIQQVRDEVQQVVRRASHRRQALRNIFDAPVTLNPRASCTKAGAELRSQHRSPRLPRAFNANVLIAGGSRVSVALVPIHVALKHVRRHEDVVQRRSKLRHAAGKKH
jgi:hypothetical protein